MAEYKIYFKRSAVKDLDAIPQKDLQRIINRIDLLKENRQGNYRIVYSIQDDVLTVWVVKIGHRRNVYR
jgi:mRNA interferase RelE/StbE